MIARGVEVELHQIVQLVAIRQRAIERHLDCGADVLQRSAFGVGLDGDGELGCGFGGRSGGGVDVDGGLLEAGVADGVYAAIHGGPSVRAAQAGVAEVCDWDCGVFSAATGVGGGAVVAGESGWEEGGES